MKDRPINKADAKAQGLESRHRATDGAVRQRSNNTLGLRAFEKISAVEGVRLSCEMREDLKSLDSRHMSAAQRSRFITGKYGKK